MHTPKSPNPNTYIHPAWRGIGCILIAVIPFASWVLGGMFWQITAQRGIALSPELQHSLNFPGIKIGDTVLFPPAALPYAQILFAFTAAVVLFGLMTVLYAVIYHLSGGGRGSPLDVPMPKKRRRRR